MNYKDKIRSGEMEGAHVAVVLYCAMGAQEHSSGGYNSREPRNEFVGKLMDYARQLKKPADRQAVIDFCAITQPTAMSQLGYDVTLEARVGSLDRGEV